MIDLLPEQKEISDLGGTMRLGADPVKLHEGTRIRELYGEPVIYERHRHRYEVNNHLRRRIEDAGLVIGGTSPDEQLVEAVELPASEHPFFVASQYHPEFKSRPERPAPLFRGFVRAALDRAAARRAPTREPCRSSARRGGVRRADAAERARARRAVRGAVRDREPVRARGGVRGSRVAELGPRSDSRRAADAARQPVGPLALGERRHRAGRPAVRASRHRSVDRPVEPVCEEGVWRNRHDAILGADNKAAVAVMLAAARRLARRAGRRSAVELLFTVCEEDALAGAKAFDASQLRSRFGYVFDHASPIGEIVLASPTYYRIVAELRGVAAHAGIRPEAGRSAIAAAARGDRRDAARPARRGDDRERRHDRRRRRRSTSCRSAAASRRRCAASTRRKVEAVVSEIVDHLHRRRQRRRVRPRRERLAAVPRLPHGRPRRRCSVAEAALRACGYTPRHIVTGGGSDANALEPPASPAPTSRTAPSATTSPTSASASPRSRACSTSRWRSSTKHQIDECQLLGSIRAENLHPAASARPYRAHPRCRRGARRC